MLLLALQAAAALALPGFIGDLISVGIQQMGVDSDYPEVLGDDTVALLERVLPDETYNLFISQYTDSASLSDKKYECDDKAYVILPTADTEKASEIYRNALMSGLSLSDGMIKKSKAVSYELIRSYGSIHQLNIRTWDMELTEEEKQSLYEDTDTFAPSIKNQVASMALPFVYEDAGVDMTEVQRAYVKNVTIKMLICLVTEVMAIVFAALLASDISSKVENEVREMLINHISGFTRKENMMFSPSQLSASVSIDAGHVGMMMDYGIRIFLYAPFAAIGGTILSFMIHPIFGCLVLVSSLIISLLMVIAFRLTVGHYNSLQQNSSGFVATVIRNLKNMFMIRAVSAEKTEEEKVNSLSEKIRKEESFVLKAVITAVSLVTLITNIITAASVIFGADRLLSSTVELGGIIKFLQYSVVSVSAFMMLGAVAVFAPRITASVKNINRILSVPISVIGGNEREFSKNPDVEFKNIDLVGRNIDFTAPFGQITAITGRTGCGKSALVSFINRYSDPEVGEVYIGGRNVKDYNLDFLCQRVAVYESIPCILTGTVRRNIAGDENIGDEKITEAMVKACIDFVKPDDYIVNSGENLSGGQKSRIALASCFIRNSSVFVFDDCMTALDEPTENRIFNEIKKLKEKACVIIVSQRPEILMNADNVAVFEEDGFVFGEPEKVLSESAFLRGIISGRNGGDGNG